MYKEFLEQEYEKTLRELYEDSPPVDCVHKQNKDISTQALREDGTCIIHDKDTEGLNAYKLTLKKLYGRYR